VAHVGLGGDALERLPRVVLVLDGEHRLERRVGKAQALRDQAGQERAELLVGVTTASMPARA
jgi:hypothetical protein